MSYPVLLFWITHGGTCGFEQPHRKERMNTKKRNDKLGLLIATAIAVSIIGFLGYWAGKYYCIVIPELPDNHYYENLEERAAAARVVAKRHKLNEDYCLFVDYSIPSGTPRLYVWSYTENRVIASTYVMHGPGMGSTAEKPIFSNRPGSKCSSLGRFVVTKQHGNKLKRSYRLNGIDMDNQTALARGLMIHRSTWVDTHCWRDYIPLHAKSCQGCVTVSSMGLNYIEKLINSQDKELMLWSFCSSRSS